VYAADHESDTSEEKDAAVSEDPLSVFWILQFANGLHQPIFAQGDSAEREGLRLPPDVEETAGEAQQGQQQGKFSGVGSKAPRPRCFCDEELSEVSDGKKHHGWHQHKSEQMCREAFTVPVCWREKKECRNKGEYPQEIIPEIRLCF